MDIKYVNLENKKYYIRPISEEGKNHKDPPFTFYMALIRQSRLGLSRWLRGLSGWLSGKVLTFHQTGPETNFHWCLARRQPLWGEWRLL